MRHMTHHRQIIRFPFVFLPDEGRSQVFTISSFKNISKYHFLYAMALPTLLWYLIFAYLPMIGIVIAFQDFKYTKGIFSSPFVGLENFKFLFNSKNLWQITFNTVYLNVLFILFGTTMSILLALMFMELRNRLYKKVTQSIAILPHFISWTVVSMFLTAFTATDTGIINKVPGRLWYDLRVGRG